MKHILCVMVWLLLVGVIHVLYRDCPDTLSCDFVLPHLLHHCRTAKGAVRLYNFKKYMRQSIKQRENDLKETTMEPTLPFVISLVNNKSISYHILIFFVSATNYL